MKWFLRSIVFLVLLVIVSPAHAYKISVSPAEQLSGSTSRDIIVYFTATVSGETPYGAYVEVECYDELPVVYLNKSNLSWTLISTGRWKSRFNLAMHDPDDSTTFQVKARVSYLINGSGGYWTNWTSWNYDNEVLNLSGVPFGTYEDPVLTAI